MMRRCGQKEGAVWVVVGLVVGSWAVGAALGLLGLTVALREGWFE